jgi:HD-GYP domain-containing protein (c-di-GMP phosphodiesterase class II)
VTDRRIDDDRARTVVKDILWCLLDHPGAMVFVTACGQIRDSDDRLAVHAVNVAILTMLVGYHSRFAFDRLYAYGLGALLHDVGEAVLPSSGWSGGSVSDEARRLAERHPLIGFRLIREIPGLPSEVACIVREHHERLDGRGYPEQLQGHRLSEAGQLVGIVDYYDRLIAGVDGRSAVSPADAMRLVSEIGRGAAWESSLVDQVVATFGVFPVGTFVTLNTGQTAIVVLATEDRLRPVVRVLTDRLGHPMHLPKFVDLREDDRYWIVRIVGERPDNLLDGGAVRSGSNRVEGDRNPWGSIDQAK